MLIAYLIYLQLPSILKAVPPSAIWGRAMLCRQRRMYHGDTLRTQISVATTYFRHLTRFPGGLPSWNWLHGKTTLLQCRLVAVWRHRRSTLACQVVRYAVEWYRSILCEMCSCLGLVLYSLRVVLVAYLVLFFLCEYNSSFWIVVFTVALVVSC